MHSERAPCFFEVGDLRIEHQCYNNEQGCQAESGEEDSIVRFWIRGWVLVPVEV